MNKDLELKQDIMASHRDVRTYVLATISREGKASVSVNGDKIDQVFLEKLISAHNSAKLLREVNMFPEGAS
jgi:hypothetical protein